MARFYTRWHLYSALRLSVTAVDKGSGRARSFTATGFLLSQRASTKRRLWLVTNRHVLDPPFDPKYASYMLEQVTVKGVVVSSRGSDDIPFEFSLSTPVSHFPTDTQVDVGMVALDNEALPASAAQMAFATTDLVGRSDIHDDLVGVGSEIVLAGYPALDNGTSERPVLVPGMVSSDLQHAAEYGGHVYRGRGMCHAFSRGGMSGAPVLTTITPEGWPEINEPPEEPVVRVLGINCGHPREKHGPEALSLFVPSWTLDEMLAEHGDLPARLRTISARRRDGE